MIIKKVLSRLLKKKKKIYTLSKIKGEIIGINIKGNIIRISTPEKKFSVFETKEQNVYKDKNNILYSISPHEFFTFKRRWKHK